MMEDRKMLHAKKIAVLFPGVGYTFDRPLLYFAAKLAEKRGYEIRRVSYGNFPKNMRGDAAKMQAAFDSAAAEAREILSDVDWGSYTEILFISKSIGTIVAAEFRKANGIHARSISYTPMRHTFLFAEGEGIMFHGTADPWEPDNAAVEEGCRRIGQPLYLFEGANHSLETGDVDTDIVNLRRVMKLTADFMDRPAGKRVAYA